MEKSLKRCPRFVGAKIAYTQHLRRVALCISQQLGLTQSARTIIQDALNVMMSFSTESGYAEIRKLTQNCVHAVVRVHQYMIPVIYPRILEALRIGPDSNPDRMKGGCGDRSLTFSLIYD